MNHNCTNYTAKWATWAKFIIPILLWLDDFYINEIMPEPASDCHFLNNFLLVRRSSSSDSLELSSQWCYASLLSSTPIITHLYCIGQSLGALIISIARYRMGWWVRQWTYRWRYQRRLEVCHVRQLHLPKHIGIFYSPIGSLVLSWLYSALIIFSPRLSLV